MQIKDRIERFDRVYARDLIPNPKNWRSHPTSQQDALKGILAEVGWADALLVRETPGGLTLIDGHLRAETAPDSLVPVLVLDVDEAEADLLLASLDPLAAMAKTNKEALDTLLGEISTNSEALQAMLDGMKPNAHEEVELPAATYEVVIECDGEQEQQEIYDRMIAEGRRCRVLTF